MKRERLRWSLGKGRRTGAGERGISHALIQGPPLKKEGGGGGREGDGGGWRGAGGGGSKRRLRRDMEVCPHEITINVNYDCLRL